jgi:hypothetical protein
LGQREVEALAGLLENEAGKILPVDGVVEDVGVLLGDGGLDRLCEVDGFGVGDRFPWLPACAD